MKLKDLLEKINDVPLNESLTKRIEARYKTKLSDEIKKIVSLSQETVFYEDRVLLRGLSNLEILNATEDLSVDFVGKSLLPLFDVGDNDFISYDFSENCWYMFNIVDEVKFKKASSIFSYL